MSDDDSTTEQGVLSSEGSSYPLVSSALSQTDCTAWLAGHGVDVHAVRSRIEPPAG